MGRVEALNQILRKLQSGTPDIEASALISDDGLIVASALPQHVEEMRVAGMSSTLLSLGTRAAVELERGEVQQILVRGDNGYAVMVGATQGTMLLVLTGRDAKLGLVFLDASRAVKEIAEIL